LGRKKKIQKTQENKKGQEKEKPLKDIFGYKRRYLVSFDIGKIPSTEVDILVIGSGVAALRAAIEASKYASVLVLTKHKKDDTNSSRAQGGIASALIKPDSPDLHIKDTLTVGNGLCDQEIVKMVINDGLDCVRELIDWGIKFDKIGSDFSLAREGGHSLPRILHKGDQTGFEIEKTLLKAVKNNKRIKILENVFVLDILENQNICYGAIVYKNGSLESIISQKIILATGGLGQVFRETTNPEVATGDGIAMAYRAGAKLQDMEFIQFHPTTLYIAGAPRVLVSEVVRGAGGKLVNKDGVPFMKDYHKMGDLAPRDIVSRALISEMRKRKTTEVYLDLSSVSDVKRNFPGLWNVCGQFGINIAKNRIPVRPSAHYMIGGIKIDKDGKTSLEGLYACGEVSGSSFHGANRLGSNSLLECLVFGKRAGRNAGEAVSSKRRDRIKSIKSGEKTFESFYFDIDDMENSLRSLMWWNVGIERSAGDLKTTLDKLRFWSYYVLPQVFTEPKGWELQNMLQVSMFITYSALLREESRGVHYRVDFPYTDDANWKKHIII
jgi:L-aspartate oxidase